MDAGFFFLGGDDLLMHECITQTSKPASGQYQCKMKRSKQKISERVESESESERVKSGLPRGSVSQCVSVVSV